jgi:hypothetical protein
MNPSQPRYSENSIRLPGYRLRLPAETSPRMLPTMIPWRLPQMPEAKVPRRASSRGAGPAAPH